MSVKKAHIYFRNVDCSKHYTYAELAEYWGCTYDAARSRVKAGRNAGYKIVIAYEHKTRPSVTPRRNFERKLDHHRDYVYADELGDKSLPICPDCKRFGNTGKRGEPVHLTIDTDDPYQMQYCPYCAYDPDAEAISDWWYNVVSAYNHIGQKVETMNND